MLTIKLSKAGQVNFEFIARYPSAMLIAGGILMVLINKTDWAVIMIALGVLTHILWLRR